MKQEIIFPIPRDLAGVKHSIQEGVTDTGRLLLTRYINGLHSLWGNKSCLIPIQPGLQIFSICKSLSLSLTPLSPSGLGVGHRTKGLGPNLVGSYHFATLTPTDLKIHQAEKPRPA